MFLPSLLMLADLSYPPLGLWLLLMLPVFYLSSFLHELGHALLARLAGYAVLSFGMGVGRPFLVWNWSGTRVYLAWTNSFQGLTFSLAPGKPPSRGRQALMLAGGVIANALLTAVGLCLYLFLPWGRPAWALIVLCNAVMVASNLFPIAVRLGRSTLLTDGGQILRVLRGRAVPSSPLDRIARLALLRGLWQDIGDYPCLYSHLAEAASARNQLDDLEMAERLCREMDALPLSGWPILEALGALVRGSVDCSAGRFESSAANLDRAEEVYRALDHEVRLFTVAWARAELLLKRGDPAGAAEMLDALNTRVPAPLAPAVGLLATRLKARAVLGDMPAVQALRTEYEKARRQQPSPARDRTVYQALGRFFVRQEDWSTAGTAYAEALRAAQQLHALFPTTQERTRYAANQVDLLAEARACFERLDEREAQNLPALSLTEEDAARRRLADQAPSNRRVRRVALGLLLVNGIAIAVLIGLTEALRSQTMFPPPQTVGRRLLLLPLTASALIGGEAGFLLVGLVLCTLLALGCDGLLGLVGRWVPALRRNRAWLLLYLAVAPWLAWLGYLLFPLD